MPLLSTAAAILDWRFWIGDFGLAILDWRLILDCQYASVRTPAISFDRS
ncbi:hypothetical protein [Leptolyngbya sp. O-77]|nr:hypothetical protein [Leptolyngbya sp. O-77]